jgi:hypothetical protein
LISARLNGSRIWIDYITLFEDSGWKSIDSKPKGYNFYFYTNAEGAQKDIFSDEASKAARYMRYAQYLGYSFFPILMMYFVLYASGTLSPGRLWLSDAGLMGNDWVAVCGAFPV